MADMMSEVARFRLWADSYPIERRPPEWECDYPDIGAFYDAILKFVNTRSFETWSADELTEILYAIARDNELQHLAEEIRSHPQMLLDLARAAIKCGEPDVKWQLAHELGYLGRRDTEAQNLLVILANDANEYVRRRSLSALARLDSSAVEELAIKEWHRPDEHQQWSRMNVLWSLHRVKSSLLDQFLGDADRDEGQHLRDFATQVRKGQVSE